MPTGGIGFARVAGHAGGMPITDRFSYLLFRGHEVQRAVMRSSSRCIIETSGLRKDLR